MAAPNIVNVTSIFGRTASLTPANTTANVLLANPADSNKVFKINLINAANTDASATVSCTVAVNSNATGTGTSTPLVLAARVPSSTSLIVTDKSTSFYLQEDQSLVVTSSVASRFSFVVSYEDIA